MKKILSSLTPLSIFLLSLLIVSSFLRYYLFLETNQLVKEFRNQNYRELYSLDTLKISSRLNSLANTQNWLCIEASIDGKPFYSLKRDNCENGILRQEKSIIIQEANNLKITFTLKLSKEIQYLFFILLFIQILLIITITLVTKKIESEKRASELKLIKLARQTFHDIRSPLATLNSIRENLTNLPASEKDLLEKSINRINFIANNLLNISKNDKSNERLPIIEKCNIVDILNEIHEAKKTEYQNNFNIELNLNTNNYKAIYCNIDKEEIKNIFSNLINNSIESYKENKLIKVDLILNLEGTSSIIQIIDYGNGIPEKILENIGLREFTNKKNGNGLGLLHAFECITEWGGGIKINSQINKGSQVIISLPILTSENETILIDDDELVRMTWSLKAKKLQINLKVFSSYEDFLKEKTTFHKEVAIYIDSELGASIKGEDIANTLYVEGFSNIFMATGHSPEKFKHLTFLKGVISKSPPF